MPTVKSGYHDQACNIHSIPPKVALQRDQERQLDQFLAAVVSRSVGRSATRMRALKDLVATAILASELAARNSAPLPDVVGVGVSGVQSIFGPYAIGKFGGVAKARKAGWV